MGKWTAQKYDDELLYKIKGMVQLALHQVNSDPSRPKMTYEQFIVCLDEENQGGLGHVRGLVENASKQLTVSHRARPSHLRLPTPYTPGHPHSAHARTTRRSLTSLPFPSRSTAARRRNIDETASGRYLPLTPTTAVVEVQPNTGRSFRTRALVEGGVEREYLNNGVVLEVAREREAEIRGVGVGDDMLAEMFGVGGEGSSEDDGGFSASADRVAALNSRERERESVRRRLNRESQRRTRARRSGMDSIEEQDRAQLGIGIPVEEDEFIYPPSDDTSDSDRAYRAYTGIPPAVAEEAMAGAEAELRRADIAMRLERQGGVLDPTWQDRVTAREGNRALERERERLMETEGDGDRQQEMYFQRLLRAQTEAMRDPPAPAEGEDLTTLGRMVADDLAAAAAQPNPGGADLVRTPSIRRRGPRMPGFPYLQNPSRSIVRPAPATGDDHVPSWADPRFDWDGPELPDVMRPIPSIPRAVRIPSAAPNPLVPRGSIALQVQYNTPVRSYVVYTEPVDDATITEIRRAHEAGEASFPRGVSVDMARRLELTGVSEVDTSVGRTVDEEARLRGITLGRGEVHYSNEDLLSFRGAGTQRGERPGRAYVGRELLGEGGEGQHLATMGVDNVARHLANLAREARPEPTAAEIVGRIHPELGAGGAGGGSEEFQEFAGSRRRGRRWWEGEEREEEAREGNGSGSGTIVEDGAAEERTIAGLPRRVDGEGDGAEDAAGLEDQARELLTETRETTDRVRGLLDGSRGLTDTEERGE